MIESILINNYTCKLHEKVFEFSFEITDPTGNRVDHTGNWPTLGEAIEDAGAIVKTDIKKKAAGSQ